jgi:hypothetical protein
VPGQASPVRPAATASPAQARSNEPGADHRRTTTRRTPWPPTRTSPRPPAQGRGGPAAAGLATRAGKRRQAGPDALAERYAPLIWPTCRRPGPGDADAENAGQNVRLTLTGQPGKIRRPPPRPSPTITPGQPGDEPPAAGRHAARPEASAALPPCCQQLTAPLTENPPPSYAQISARPGRPAGSAGPSRGRRPDKLRRHPAITALTNPGRRDPGMRYTTT